MKERKQRLLLALAALVGAGLCAVGVLAIPAVEDALFAHLVERHLRAGGESFFKDDALKVLLCGTSAPVADPERAQSCVAVFAGGKYYLVDTGPGSGRNLELWQLQGRRLGAVFLTHFHSDHIGDLGEVNTNAWLAGHAGPLPVFGGAGVERVVAGFNAAYSQDQTYRTANSGSVLLPPTSALMQPTVIAMPGAPTPQKDRKSAPMRFGALSVTAIEVDHEPADPAYGYRFDYRGRSVVISGDTQEHLPLAQAAQGADVLIHEAQSQHLVQLVQKAAEASGNMRIAHILAGIVHYHTDPPAAARIANEAQVRLLVFTHFNPPVTNLLTERMFFRGVAAMRPAGWIAGKDGMLITLPIGTTAVHVSVLAR